MAAGRPFPRDGILDSTAAFLREGHTFVSTRCRRLGTDAFEARLLLQPAVCMQGAEAARSFCSPRFTRRGALPRPVFALVQDVGSVATLDGAAHRHRKRMFLDMMGDGDGPVARLEELCDHGWRLEAERWRRADHVVLLPAVERLLCRAACAWAGIPLGEPEAERRTAELSAMVEGAGSFGPRNLRGHFRRRAGERWAASVVRRIRSGGEPEAARSPAETVAHHRGLDGRPLSEGVAAVELLNIVRPAVAAARFVVFAAMALCRHPELRPRLRDGDELLEPFVHEVRRFYPFFPAIAGRAVEDTEYRGHPVPAGRRVLLDLYGTNRDPHSWDAPEQFRPERFVGWRGDPFTLVPQGGGDHLDGHRCPGEWLTLAIMRSAVRALTRGMTYAVPPQDLEIRPSHIPPRPRSGFVITEVAPRG